MAELELGRNLWLYNLRDCVRTAMCDLAMDKELEEAGLTQFYHELVQPLYRSLYRLQCRGLGIDRSRHKALSEQYADKVSSLEVDLRDIVGGEVVDPGSRDQWRDYLYEKLKLKPRQRTEKRQVPKLTKVILYQHILYDDLPLHVQGLLRLLLKWFEYRHIKSSFIDNVFIYPDDRVRATWKGRGSRTGRPTSAGPDLQNIPKRRHKIRSMYRATPGKRLINCDAARMEMTFIGLASGAAKLTEMCLKDLDIHSYNLYLIQGKAKGDESIREVEAILNTMGRAPDDGRDPVKGSWFAYQYGASDETIALAVLEDSEGEIVMMPDDVARFRAAVTKAYPEIPRWWSEVRSSARATMMVRNEWGRPRVLYSGDTHGVPPNTIIQGTGADWVNGIFVELDNRTEAKQRVGEVVHHGWDSLMDETTDSRESINTMAELFSKEISVFGSKVSMPFSIEEGEYWGELETVKL